MPVPVSYTHLSDFGERVLRSAFRYQGETFCYGSPRNDCLVNYDPEKAAAIRKKIGVEEGVRLLIFCPTFRDSSRQTALKSGVDLEKALDDLEPVSDTHLDVYKRQNLYDYDVYPKIVRAGCPAEITIRPTGGRQFWFPGQEYDLTIKALFGGNPAQYPDSGCYETRKVRCDEDGCLRIRHTFEKEQEYFLDVAFADQEGRPRCV